MSEIISVMTIFDVKKILKDYPTPSKDPNNPTGLPHPVNGKEYPYMYMLVTAGNVISGQADGNLNFSATTDDVVRWRSQSMSGDASQAAVMYGFFKFGGNDVITPPGAVLSHPTVPVPNPANPVTFTAQSVPDFYWRSDVIATGVENYGVRFYITGIVGSQLTTLGYFYWDPTITVNI